MGDINEKQEVIDARHRMCANISKCQGVRDCVYYMACEMWSCLFKTCTDMRRYNIADFKMDREADGSGVKTEIEKTVRMIDQFHRSFHEVLDEYEKLEDNND